MGLTEKSLLERCEEMGIRPTPNIVDYTNWAYNGVDIAIRSGKSVDELCDFLRKAWAIRTTHNETNTAPSIYPNGVCIQRQDEI